MRTTIEIRGARENNLNNVDVEIPRDKLVVVTGMSGSGKSSLAFETLYAEGQRRLMASMSSFAKRFIQQIKKPDVDFVSGLSPVISIDQKTVGKNPRSTVGTLTDIGDYMRMLFATIGQPHCPDCEEALRVLTPIQMMEHVLSLPRGTEVEVRAPAWRPFGDDWETLLEAIRVNGYRRIRVDGEIIDLGEDVELSEDRAPWVDVIVDRFVVADHIDRAVVASLEHARKIGDGLVSFHVLDVLTSKQQRAFYAGFGCLEHQRMSMDLRHREFTFNDPLGACVTCSGLGTAKRAWPPLLTPDPTRSLRDGALLREAMNADKNTSGGRQMYSLSQHYGFSLDEPFESLPDIARKVLFYGTDGESIPIRVPPDARQGHHHEGKEMTFQGIIPWIERWYRHYRKHGDANVWSEDYFKKVMVEYNCPDCEGARLKKVRRLVKVSDRNISELGDLHLVDLLAFLDDLTFPARHEVVGRILLQEITGRLRTLIDIGLDYLSLNRRAATLSGGESQRIRLSTQIGSGLMGMLYVLDEPSIGLHPKDNAKMIGTLRRLVDIGNTVVVVEHDEDTIRAADHIIEMGPGPGIHGGNVVVTGPPAVIEEHTESPTGQFLSGRRKIAVPDTRRAPGERWLEVRGARHNNLADVDARIPLGLFVAITGASGSGKSSLLLDIVHKKLINLLQDSRVLSGEHDAFLGSEHVDAVVHIDQSPIGRSPRSNPATYIGFYDHIRKIFAKSDIAVARGWTPARFSFNVKGGRCEECAGEGTITTKLSFMPDVEVVCPTCKGARYNAETLEATHKGKTIYDVLELSIEEGVAYFADQKTIHRKISVLHELGLGYLKIGHPAPILSGGEAQRVKLAEQLGKLKRGKHILYLLDEPTTGLHMADVGRLLESLGRLVDRGHTVVVIEHNLDVIKTADWVIDLGPEGGHRGGRILAAGKPEDIAACDASHTGTFLRLAL